LFARRIAIVLICAGTALAAASGTGSTETLLERGSYLVNTIGGCGRCHTPRDAQGKPKANMELAGGFEFDDGMIGHVVGPNITPDRETGIGKWSEAQMITAMRYGTRPDGSIIGPPMPVDTYRGMSDRDLAAIAKYLQSIKPVRHAVGRTQYKNPPSPHDPALTKVEEPPRQDRLAYGAYLAGPVGHCFGCHTVFRKDGRSLDRQWLYAGGRALPDYGDLSKKIISRNITSDPDDGIGKWSDDDIKRAISHGVRPDGTRLGLTMPSDWYAKIAPADLDALVAFLRTVKPLKTPSAE
jgi:mono/diheme cytochrome c family protein